MYLLPKYSCHTHEIRMHDIAPCPRTDQMQHIICSSVQTLTRLWMVYAFLWVMPQCLNFMCRCFRTPCLFHPHWLCEQEETSAHNIQTLGHHPKEIIHHHVITNDCKVKPQIIWLSTISASLTKYIQVCALTLLSHLLTSDFVFSAFGGIILFFLFCLTCSNAMC